MGDPRNDTYENGVEAGARDANTLLLPINTLPHTLDEYLRIKAAYEAAIFKAQPSDYQRGYANAMDTVAEANFTPEQLVAGIERYNDEL